MRHLTLLAAVLPLVCAAACTGDDSLETDGGASYNCAKETRGDAFTVGLEKHGKSGLLDFKMMSVDPGPSLVGDNTWVLQINQMSSGVVGGPMQGATLTVSPYMPDHQHSSPIEAEVTEMPATGQYTLDPVFFSMPGVWETTIIATAGTTTDSAVYTFCIPN